ncbi:unnamed protein product, partial [Mesorhabditis spiculigera]
MKLLAIGFVSDESAGRFSHWFARHQMGDILFGSDVDACRKFYQEPLRSAQDLTHFFIRSLNRGAVRQLCMGLINGEITDGMLAAIENDEDIESPNNLFILGAPYEQQLEEMLSPANAITYGLSPSEVAVEYDARLSTLDKVLVLLSMTTSNSLAIVPSLKNYFASEGMIVLNSRPTLMEDNADDEDVDYSHRSARALRIVGVLARFNIIANDAATRGYGIGPGIEKNPADVL